MSAPSQSQSYDAAVLDKAKGVTVVNNLCLFYQGAFSNFRPCRFVVDGVTYHSSEQYMMCAKARFFEDEAMLQRMLNKQLTPAEVKQLGRQVKGFDADKWDAVCQEFVYHGCLAKFTQKPELKALLLATGSLTLVEASPKDKIWGIGLAASDPRAHSPDTWLGTNYLGVVLGRVRDTILQNNELVFTATEQFLREYARDPKLGKLETLMD